MKDFQKHLDSALAEIELINEVIRQIPGKGRFDDVIQTIMEKAEPHIGVDLITIALIDRKAGTIDPLWISKVPYEIFRKSGKGLISLEDTNDIAVRCVTEKKPMLSNDPGNDPRVNQEVIRITKTKAFVLLPLIVQGDSIGFMGFTTYDPKKKLKVKDIEKFQRFVDTLSLFFHNARLYDELENWSHTLEERVEEKTREVITAHEEIWKMRENLAAIVENDTSGIIATDQTGTIAVMNKAASAIFKGELASIQKSHISHLFREEDYKAINKVFQSSKPTKNIPFFRNVEKEMVAIDGTLVPVHISAMKLISREGSPFGFLFIIQDLREIRFLEGQVIQGEKLKLLGEMAAGISHEINTPLGIIKGAVSVLKTLKLPSDGILNKQVSIIEQSLERGENFVKELLHLAKPSPPRFLRLDFTELVKSGIKMILPKFKDLPIRFTIDAEPGVPSIYGDLQKLHQVLFNLLDNAVDASQKKGEIIFRISGSEVTREDLAAAENRSRRKDDSPERDFHVFRKPKPEQVDKLFSISKPGDKLAVLQVIDSGTGITPEVLPRLFDPFFSTKHKTGTGLGLAIVKGIIRRHHGSILVTSEAGKGTTFTVKLPAYDDIVQFERMI